QFSEADGHRVEVAFGEAEGAHADADDPTGARVGGLFDRGGAAGEQERARFGTGVDPSPDLIPYGRVPLPLVDQHRRGGSVEEVRVRGGDLGLTGIVESHDGPGPAERRRRLADSLGAVDGDGGETREELIELVVHDATPVEHTLNPTSALDTTLPFPQTIS